MSPRSIAFVGASNNPLKMGTMQAVNIVNGNFKGAFYPLHPTEKTVLGHPAFAKVADLPEVPDLVIFVSPAPTVAPYLEELGKIGVKRAIVITAGFREMDEAGARREDELNAIASRYQMRFLGPNCIGIINTEISLNATVVHMQQNKGSLGLASQSGTYVTQTLGYLHKKGICFSKAISLGNEANLNICDALEYLGEDEQTRAIILYIEGIREGRRFIDIAQRVSRRKPILAQYSGGSQAGAKAGKSHTGAMAGPDVLYDGIFAQAGIIRVDTIEDLFAHGWALAKQPLPRGNRLGVITNSGGPGAAASHHAEISGFRLPTLSGNLQNKLRQLIPAHASAANPVDVTFHLDVNLIAKEIPLLLANSGEVDALILHGAMQTAFLEQAFPQVSSLHKGEPLEKLIAKYEKHSQELVADLAEALKRHGIPLVASTFFEYNDNFSAAFRQANIPVFDAPEKAARALGSLWKYANIRQRAPFAHTNGLTSQPEATAMVAAARQNGQSALDEFSAKRLLALYGLPIVPGNIASNKGQACAIATKIGYPIVAKGCSWRALHKSELGLVALDIANERELKAAFAKIAARLEQMGESPRLVIEKMVSGSRELMLGMTRFAGFGACLSFGLGGVFTEALQDITFRCAPLSLAEALEMLDGIRSYKLLGDYRGMAAVKREELARIISTVGEIALAHPEIAEIDINPLLIGADGSLTVVDALVVLENYS